MTGMHRKLGTLLVLSALVAPASLAQDIQTTFDDGVALLKRGEDEQALAAFKKVLAADPSHAQAYELFKTTEHDIWMEILTKQGDFELVAKRLMGLARMGRAEHRDDPDAIRGLIASLSTDDPITRRTAIRTLAAEHGEYAVPYLLPALADQSDEERRVSAMQALTEMNTRVVPPLIAALASEDSFLRRNVALTLGYIKDARARGPLGALAEFDDDGTVAQAAGKALERIGGATGAVNDLVAAGNGYHMRRDDYLAPHQYSEVVWSYADGTVHPTPVRRELYADEVAKQSFALALAVAPTSTAAQAGMARAQASQVAILEALRAVGVDDSDFAAAVEAGGLKVQLAGAAAVDAALMASVSENDNATAGALVAAVADLASSPTAGLRAALGSNDGALRSHAAIALGHMCLDGRATATPQLTSDLGAIAGRAIVRIAFIVDANAARAEALSKALTEQGMLVTIADSGVHGIAMLRQVAGVDAVIVAEKLPDLTTAHVLAELRADPRTSGAATLVLAKDAEAAAEVYGDSITGVITGAADAGAVSEALSDGMNAERARADALSQKAAKVLAGLASAGADVSPALDALAGTLGSRPDSVAVPAARALGIAGGPSHTGALLAVIADTEASDELRIACARAAGSIFSRGGGMAEAADALAVVMNSDASLELRSAAASALGSLDLTAEARAALLGS